MTEPRPELAERWREVRAALRDRDFKAALPMLEDLYDEAPDDVQTIFLLGACYANLGRLEEAKAQFKRVVRRDPSHAGAWFNLARIYGLLGRRHKMRVSLRKALKADPTHDKARRAAEKYGITLPPADAPADGGPPLPATSPPAERLDAAAELVLADDSEPATEEGEPDFGAGPVPEPLAEPQPAAADDLPFDFGDEPGAPSQRWQLVGLRYGQAADLGWRFGLVIGVSIGLVCAGLVLAEEPWSTAVLTAVACVVGGAASGALAALLAVAGVNLSCFLSRGVIVDIRRDVRQVEVLRLETGPWAWTVAIATLLCLLLGAGVWALAARLAPPMLAERLPELGAEVARLPGGWLSLAGALLLLTAASQAVMAVLYNVLAGSVGGLVMHLKERERAFRCTRYDMLRSLRPAVPLAWVFWLPALLAAVATWHSEPAWLSPLVSGLSWLLGAPLLVAAQIALYNSLCDHVRGLEINVIQREAPGPPALHSALTTPTRWK